MVRHSGLAGVAAMFGLCAVAGCGSALSSANPGQRAGAGSSRQDPDSVGRTYYIDGAGNWGYGVLEIHEGLRRAGYRGNIINYRWSPTFNPALDQTVGRPVARLKGKLLGQEITAYHASHPGCPVNIIALSAGTGVAVWACESIQSPATVHNLVLLGSSLSSDYDMRDALSHMTGMVWVYHSRSDQILAGPVRALGTIDGKMGVEAAGMIGLHPPGIPAGRIQNVPWSARYERYGWTGAHTDATSEPFVRTHLARHIIEGESESPAETATRQDGDRPAASPVAFARF